MEDKNKQTAKQPSGLVAELDAKIEIKKLASYKVQEKKKISNAPYPTKVFALGGLEEVGKNTYCIEYDDELIMIDAGVKFPDATQLGVSAVIPDFSYLVENNSKVKALFITHGHEDHIGGIPYLLQQVEIPVIYAPELAAALIKDRLKEYKLQNKTVVREYVENDIYASKHFNIQFSAVNHSIPDAFGIYVQTPNGSIFSTGDYKFDWTPLGHSANVQRLAQWGNDGIELLMADSTNAEVEGYTLGERKVIQNIDTHFLKAKGRIIIASFASNVHRLQHIIELANKYGRSIVVIGRSIERIIKIIRQMGHLNINDKMFIKPTEIENFPKNQIMILCTGSQGEPMAALSRISRMEHQTIKLIPGDTVIMSSSPIPGNRADVENVINKLTKIGATVIENSLDNKIHTSGHASQEEQKLLFTLLKPRCFMPMHGEYRMLKIHGETAVSVNVKPHNVFVVANGDQILLHNGNAELGKRVPADAIFIDGKDMTGKASNVIRERNILSRDGLMAVIISIDSQTNKLSAPPRIVSRGSFYVRDSGNVIAESINIVTNAVNDVLKSQKPTFGAIKNAIKESLSPFIFRYKRRNPLIIPVILNKKTEVK
ncbi:ribonuclease J [Spiroplasma taiwanense]|uniref:Ribonuclease J n=1 Tax=Spiroplasma taiwanense CT-1 TaxID=1276220 RepID=S5LUQ4_9MOLU|nr:ribonuclease J [Spiroplasma taiwanense]AGR41534.1 metallo-beta-lactamase family protein [Spiroplasma taiwanense CT-1]